jgi:hypothetical protein
MGIATNVMLLNSPLFAVLGGEIVLGRIDQAVLATRDGEVVRMMLSGLSLSALKKLNESLTTTNNVDARLSAMTRALFETDLAAIQNQEAALGKFKETLGMVVKLAFYSSYFESSFDWKKYGADVHNAIVEKVQEPPARDFGAMGL